jgi:hypothetical protein
MKDKELEKAAERISDYANECCNRSDGYKEDVRELALKELKWALSQKLSEELERRLSQPTGLNNDGVNQPGGLND